MQYIFLIAAFNAFFFASLVYRKKNAQHDKVLIFWLIYLGIYTGVYGLYSDVLFTSYHLLSTSFLSLLMLHGPFLYLYISALIMPDFKFTRDKLLHFLPFILFNTYIVIASFFPDIATGIRLDHVEHGQNTPLLFNIFLILVVLSGPIYFVLSIILFKKLDISIFNNFSSYKNINLEWLRKLVYSFGFIWTLLMIIATIHHVFRLFSLTFCTDGLSLSLSAFVILIGYFGLRQQEIFTQNKEDNNAYVNPGETKEKYGGITIDRQILDNHVTLITQYMEKNKAYLDADLSLQQMAERLTIPSHQLSRIINEQFGVNFFDFVNSYRIEEVKKRIGNPKFENLSLLGIAYDSGFNSKSAFNRVFKKMEGITPSEYKKKNHLHSA